MQALYDYINGLDLENRLMARKMLDLFQRDFDNQPIRATDYLTPHENAIVESILHHMEGIYHRSEGGSIDSERKVILFSWSEQFLDQSIDEWIGAVAVSGLSKASTHRDVLGSLLGLGINRNKIGDIYVEKEIAYILMKKEFLEFVTTQLKEVGRNNVYVEEKDLSIFQNIRHELVEEKHIVASTRLDNIVAAVLNTSRGKAVTLIERKNVRLNWLDTTKKNTVVKERDVFSIKGKGKYQFDGIIKETKKKNLVIGVKRYI